MFESTFTAVRQSIVDNYKTHLDALQFEKSNLPLAPPNRVVVDVFDSDKYRDNVVMYVQPTDFEMSSLSNHSEIVSNRITIITSFRGRDSSELITLALRYLEAFRNMVRSDFTFSGACDDSRIVDAHIYAAVEGTPNMAAFEATLLVESEEQ